jgi:hypothetical protein
MTEAPAPAPAKTKDKAEVSKEPSYAAIVFDPSKEKQRNSVLSFFAKLMNARQAPNPSPSSLIVPRLPVLNELNQYQSAGDPLIVRIGANVGIEEKVLTELMNSQNPAITRYIESGCFKLYRPMDGRQGLCYADYEEKDAIELVAATLATAFLDEWIEGEDRFPVKKMYEAVSTEIAQQLADRQEN